MRRLFALLVLALSLAMASGPAFAVPRVDCPMAQSNAMQGNHAEMDCCAAACAPDCATACPGAVIPFPENAKAPDELFGDMLRLRPTDSLPSAEMAGADPPPRSTFS